MKVINKFCLIVFLGITSMSYSQLDDPNFFPRAVWLQNPNKAQQYKDKGINMYLGLWYDLDQPQLDYLTDAGMYVMCKQKPFGLANLSDTIISGWVQQDEPDIAQWNNGTNSWGPCVDPSNVISNYNDIKANDPNRPVFLNLSKGVSDIDWIGRGSCTGDYDMYKEDLNGYLKGCDIMCFDIYPANNSDALTSENFWYVAKGLDSLNSWASTPKVTWAMIETTHIKSNFNRQPTPSEVKAEVWMSVVHGATGIAYFCHSWTPSFNDHALLSDVVMMDSVASINAWLDSLAPVINSPTTNYTTVTSSDVNIPVDIMTKNYNGYDYIFAVSMRNGTTNGTFDVPSGAVIEVIGEDRTINSNGGQFTDEFVNYGVHIYRTQSTASVPEVKNEFEIYPNPTSGLINIKSLNGTNVMSVIVYNNVGQKVFENSNSQTIDLSNVESGIYFVTILTQEGSVTKKIILE